MSSKQFCIIIPNVFSAILYNNSACLPCNCGNLFVYCNEAHFKEAWCIPPNRDAWSPMTNLKNLLGYPLSISCFLQCTCKKGLPSKAFVCSSKDDIQRNSKATHLKLEMLFQLFKIILVALVLFSFQGQSQCSLVRKTFGHMAALYIPEIYADVLMHCKV